MGYPGPQTSRYNPAQRKAPGDGGRKGHRDDASGIMVRHTCVLPRRLALYWFREPSSHKSHHSVAVYIPNISITIAWGLKWQQRVPGRMVPEFSSPKGAYGGYADVFFNNALVYRSPYMWVDGIFFPNPVPRDKGIGSQQTSLHLHEADRIHGQRAPPRPPFVRSGSAAGRLFVVNGEWPEFPEI